MKIKVWYNKNVNKWGIFSCLKNWALQTNWREDTWMRDQGKRKMSERERWKKCTSILEKNHMSTCFFFPILVQSLDTVYFLQLVLHLSKVSTSKSFLVCPVSTFLPLDPSYSIFVLVPTLETSHHLSAIVTIIVTSSQCDEVKGVACNDKPMENYCLNLQLPWIAHC